MRILVLNTGSSSIKASIFDIPASAPLWQAQVEWGRAAGMATLRAAGVERSLPMSSAGQLVAPLVETAGDGMRRIDVAGHRVVHGGALRESTFITPEVKAEIARVAEFAPEHNPRELEVIEAAQAILGPGVPHVAVFDTAFHATLPPAATVYPVPYDWFEAGVRRYGFHGTSHQYASQRAAEVLGRDAASLRMITCHLGNGASLAAVRGGRSVDTTMGFTPLEGVMMGTRSGSVDPGILIYAVRRWDYSGDRLDRVLNKESGLLGVSGVSGDMREILAAIDRGDERARLAFDVYVHRLCRGIGAMLAALGGLDALVFTAGIGENCPPLREMVCRRFAFLGLEIDAEKNARSPRDEDVAAPGSHVRAVVIHTEEDWLIARACYRLNGTHPEAA